METKDTLSSCSNSEEQQMQQIQDKAKKSCMVSFRQLHSHLKLLSNNDLQGTRTESGFKRAFATLFGQDIETFTGTMFLYVDQLEKQLDKEEFQEIGSMASFKVLETQFQMFIKSRIYLDDEYVVMTRNYFLQYTQLTILEFRDTLIQHMESVKKSIDERAKNKQEKQWNSIKRARYQAKQIRQQHTEQPEFNNEGEVDQNVEQCHDTCPLPAKITDNQTTEHSYESLESENICTLNLIAVQNSEFTTTAMNHQVKAGPKVVPPSKQTATHDQRCGGGVRVVRVGGWLWRVLIGSGVCGWRSSGGGFVCGLVGAGGAVVCAGVVWWSSNCNGDIGRGVEYLMVWEGYGAGAEVGLEVYGGVSIGMCSVGGLGLRFAWGYVGGERVLWVCGVGVCSGEWACSWGLVMGCGCGELAWWWLGWAWVCCGGGVGVGRGVYQGLRGWRAGWCGEDVVSGMVWGWGDGVFGLAVVVVCEWVACRLGASVGDVGLRRQWAGGEGCVEGCGVGVDWEGSVGSVWAWGEAGVADWRGVWVLSCGIEALVVRSTDCGCGGVMEGWGVGGLELGGVRGKMETKDTLSSCSNSEEQQMQQIQDKAKKSCMVSFRQLHSHLKILSNNDLQGTRTESGFKREFATLFSQDIETFTGIMFLYVDQLEKQLDKEEFQENGSMAAFKTTEGKVDTGKALDASLVDTERSGTSLKEQDTSSRSGNDAHADDADIRPIYDEEPMTEVHTTAEINIFATGQQHIEQPEFNNEGEVDQNVEQCHDTCPLHATLTDNQTTELSNQSLKFCKIFKTVGLRLVPTGKIFTSSTTKVGNEPTNGSNEDITNQYECEQTLDVSAGTLNLSAGTSFNPQKEGLRVCSELGIHDHNNEPSSSKLVPKVVPPADKTATSRQKTKGTQELNDEAILRKFKVTRLDITQEFEDHTLGEIVSLKYVCKHGSLESAGSLTMETRREVE
ncbi:hypothetical protein Tco_0232597 [Tanacetum coccineum]